MLHVIRRHWALALVLVAAGPLYLIWSCSDRLGHLGGDAAYYLMTAHAYTPSAVPDIVYSAVAHDSRFPPLYPLLLAAFAAADNLQLTSIIDAACFVLALVVLYVWQMGLGLPTSRAAALTLVIGLLPESYLLALCPQSEYLYLLLSLLVLLFIDRFERIGRERDLYVAAFLLAAACLTRTIGMALFAPMIVILIRSRRLRLAGPLFVAMAPVLAWHLIHSAKSGYGDILESTYAETPLTSLLRQTSGEWDALRYGFAQDILQTGRMFVTTQALAILVLVGTAWRAAQLRADGIYVVIYLAILLVWPFPEEAARFVWTVLPIGLVQLVLLASRARPAHLPSALTALLIGSLLALTLPSLAIIAERYRAGELSDIDGANRYLAWYDPDPAKALTGVLTQKTIVEGLVQIEHSVPADVCVISVKPELVSYYAHRFSSLPPMESASDADFQRGLRESGCSFVAMLGGVQPTYPTAMYPSQRIAGESKVIDVRGFSMDSPPKDYITFKLAKLADPAAR